MTKLYPWLVLVLAICIGCTDANDSKKTDSASKATADGSGATSDDATTDNDSDDAEAMKVAKPAATPTALFEAISTLIAKGDARPIVMALPKSYRQDVTNAIALAAKKIDPSLYDQAMATIGKFGKLATTKADWIVANPMVSMMGIGMIAQNLKIDPQEATKVAKTIVESIGAIVTTVTNSDIKTHSGLSKFEFDAFMTTTVSDLSKQIHAITALIPDASKIEQSTFEILEQQDTTAKVKLSTPGEEPETVDVVLVEGCWIPKEMSAAWTERMAEFESKIEDTPMTAQDVQKSMAMIAMANQALDQLLGAKSQDEFNMALAGVMRMMQGAGPGQGAPR